MFSLTIQILATRRDCLANHVSAGHSREIIWLDFYIWDTGDSALDSLVLIDNFEWLVEPTEVITKL